VQNRYLFVLLAVAIAFLCSNTPAFGQTSNAPEPGIQASFVGSALTCSQPVSQGVSVIRVPAPLVERAKVKARLAALLRDSLFDDARGIVNTAREKEIRKLASKLRGRE
jgi:hypothetical protein